MTDLETITPKEFGHSLSGVGVNLLCRDVKAMAQFCKEVLGAALYQLSNDFAIIEIGPSLLQLHSDGSFAHHPALGFVPDNPPRGGGIQLYVFDKNPDQAADLAHAYPDAMVLEQPKDKPHGLRECTIAGPEGYIWIVAQKI